MTKTGERAKKRGGVSGDDWQIIFCSLTLILVAFFILLVSYSIQDQHKLDAFARHVQKKEKTDGVLLKETKAEQMMAQSNFDNAAARVHSLVQESAYKEQIQVQRLPSGIKMNIDSEVLFPSGIARINEEAKPFLLAASSIVRENDFMVKIEGHTDNVPIKTRQFPSNWELSTARAVNVLRFFLEEGQVRPERLYAVGFSQYRPIASNDTAEGRKQNRRVEIYLQSPSQDINTNVRR